MAGNRKISCPRYEPGERRSCRYYAAQSCKLADGAPCIEWLTANGEPVPKDHPLAQRDLLGMPVSPPLQASTGKHVSSAPTEDAGAGKANECQYCLRAEDIQSFKELGVEVQFVFEYGEVWLVPEYTESERIEISVKDAATLFLLLSSFPGSKISAFEKLS